MGQISQIYVRYDKKLVIANYYQWNYGERMISRARYGIEYIKENCIECRDWVFDDTNCVKKLSRIFDVNFDMKDVAISQDIIEEWKERFIEDNFNDFVFRFQGNNDGKLFVNISEDGTLKYVFLDCECNIEHLMDAKRYMDWNNEEWRHDEYIDDEQKVLCEENLNKIDEMAVLMTKEEIEDFINYDYEVEELPF